MYQLRFQLLTITLIPIALVMACGVDEPSAFSELPRESVFLKVEDDGNNNTSTSNPDETNVDDDYNDDDISEDVFEDALETWEDDDLSSSDVTVSSSDDIASDQSDNEDDFIPGDRSESSLGGLSQAEINACSRIQGVASEKIQVVADNNVSMKANSIVALKIVGNQSVVDLEMNASGQSIEGICIFMAGNKASLTITVIDLVIEKMVYLARGNQSSGAVALRDEAKIGELAVDLKGNQSHLEIFGYSDDCYSAILSSHTDSSQFFCE